MLFLHQATACKGREKRNGSRGNVCSQDGGVCSKLLLNKDPSVSSKDCNYMWIGVSVCVHVSGQHRLFLELEFQVTELPSVGAVLGSRLDWRLPGGPDVGM